MNREITAFLIAALAAPTLFAVFLFPGAPDSSANAIAIGVSFVFSFIGVFLLGVPTYYYLLAKGWTAFWIAPLVGFVVANVTFGVFFFLFALGFGGSSPWVALAAGLISPLTGSFGAAVGAIVWLIARPDRARKGH